METKALFLDGKFAESFWGQRLSYDWSRPMAKLTATIKCPHCEFRAVETMPTDRCQFFYECPNCHSVLRPKPGQCCVYCSYADKPCPAVQESQVRSGTPTR